MSKSDVKYVPCPYCKYRGVTPTRNIPVYTCHVSKHPKAQIRDDGTSDQLIWLHWPAKNGGMPHPLFRLDHTLRVLARGSLRDGYQEALVLINLRCWETLKYRINKWRNGG